MREACCSCVCSEGETEASGQKGQETRHSEGQGEATTHFITWSSFKKVLYALGTKTGDSALLLGIWKESQAR